MTTQPENEYCKYCGYIIEEDIFPGYCSWICHTLAKDEKEKNENKNQDKE